MRFFGDVSFLLADAAAPVSRRSLFEYIHAGGLVGYTLVLLSILAVALLIAHLLKVRLSVMAPTPVILGLEDRLQRADTAGAIEFCRNEENKSFLANTFAGALTRCSRSSFGLLELRSALEDSGSKEVEKLIRTTDGIAIIAAIGPMMGLLGTTIGMIGAFATIGQLEGAARSNELSGYMSLALVTTAQGLFVAIPCTVLYTILRRRVERLAAEVGEIVEDLAANLNTPGSDRRPARSTSIREHPEPAPVS
ncbi:MAG: MotA/TolQ/ExbB proton channel family protein [Phycisphaeraceae bacterium]|nr:MotA/TolQ/ExbB proton channel family protein [Phycisphaeraceae bacterium]